MNDKPNCIGSGLITLDILIKDLNFRSLSYYAGGSCGNVLMILSHLGWNVFPIARLNSNKHAVRLLNDFKTNDVNLDFITLAESGSTPIIIQRNIVDKFGIPKHKFELIDPKSGKYLPRFKSITKKMAEDIMIKTFIPEVFYFDRLTPGIMDLVKFYKNRGTLIVFEPSSIKPKEFLQICSYIDIIKYSDQRIRNYKELFSDCLIPLEIETNGANGLEYRFNLVDNKWQHLNPIKINNVIDASGAGDWSTAGIIFSINNKYNNDLNKINKKQAEEILIFAQKLGALNCLYEGARGLMKHSKNEIFCEIEKL